MGSRLVSRVNPSPQRIPVGILAVLSLLGATSGWLSYRLFPPASSGSFASAQIEDEKRKSKLQASLKALQGQLDELRCQPVVVEVQSAQEQLDNLRARRRELLVEGDRLEREKKELRAKSHHLEAAIRVIEERGTLADLPGTNKPEDREGGPRIRDRRSPDFPPINRLLQSLTTTFHLVTAEESGLSARLAHGQVQLEDLAKETVSAEDNLKQKILARVYFDGEVERIVREINDVRGAINPAPSWKSDSPGNQAGGDTVSEAFWLELRLALGALAGITLGLGIIPLLSSRKEVAS